MTASKFSALVLLTATLAAFGTACSAGGHDDEATETEGAVAGAPLTIASGEFTLSENPPGMPAPVGGATHVESLTIQAISTTGTAKLTSSCAVCGGEQGKPVFGGVPVPSYETTRTYDITVTAGSCRTKIYTGTSADGSTVKITDYRRSTCLEIPADVFVEETSNDIRTERYGTSIVPTCPEGQSAHYCEGAGVTCLPEGKGC